MRLIASGIFEFSHDVILFFTALIGFATSYLGYQMTLMNKKLNGHIEQHRTIQRESEEAREDREPT